MRKKKISIFTNFLVIQRNLNSDHYYVAKLQAMNLMLVWTESIPKKKPSVGNMSVFSFERTNLSLNQ